MATLTLKGDSSGSVNLVVPAVAGTNTVTIPAATGTLMLSTNSYSWPATYGTSGQVLSTDGAGNLSWINAGGGGGGTVNSGTVGQLAYYAATGTAVSGFALGTAGQALTVNSGATGLQWVTPAKVTISDTAPSSPAASNLWWESDSGILYIYYNDGTTSQWVQASPSAGGNVLAGTTSGTITLAAPAVAGTNTITFPAVTSTATVLSDFTGTNQLLSGNGYQKFPGGLIIQWATVGATVTANTYNTFSLPIAFPNSFFAVSASSINYTVPSAQTTLLATPSGNGTSLSQADIAWAVAGARAAVIIAFGN
jgi:hypothetical protein